MSFDQAEGISTQNRVRYFIISGKIQKHSTVWRKWEKPPWCVENEIGGHHIWNDTRHRHKKCSIPVSVYFYGTHRKKIVPVNWNSKLNLSMGYVYKTLMGIARQTGWGIKAWGPLSINDVTFDHDITFWILHSDSISAECWGYHLVFDCQVWELVSVSL